MCETPSSQTESYSWVSSWFSASKNVEDDPNSCSLDCPQAVPTNRCSADINARPAPQNCSYAPEEDMCAVRPLCFEESSTDCAVTRPSSAVSPKPSNRTFNRAPVTPASKSCRPAPAGSQQEPCYDPSATPTPAGRCFVGPPPDAYGCLPPHLPVEDPNCAPVVTSSDFVHSFMWKAAECEKCNNNNNGSNNRRSTNNNNCEDEDPQCTCCDEFDPCACNQALEALDLGELDGVIPDCDCQANGCLDILAANADLLCQFHKDVNDIRDKLHEQAQCMQQEALERALERYQQSLRDAEERLKDCHNQNRCRIQEDRQNLGNSLAPKIENLKQCIQGLQCQLQKCQCEKQKLQNTLGRMVSALQNTLNSPDDCIPAAVACAAKNEDTSLASKCAGGDRGEGRSSRGFPSRTSCTALNGNFKPSGPSKVIKRAEDGSPAAAASPNWSLRRKLSVVNCSYVRESMTRLISPMKPSHEVYKDLSKNPFSSARPAKISDSDQEYHFGLSTSDH